MIRTTTQTVYLFLNGNMVKTVESIWDTPEQVVKAQQDAKYGLVQEEYLIEIVNDRGDVQFIRPTAVASVVVAILHTEEIPDFEEPVYDDLQKKWQDELGLKVPVSDPRTESVSTDIAIVTATDKNGTGLRFSMASPPQQKVRVNTANGDITQPIDLGLLKDVSEEAPTAMMDRVGGSFPGTSASEALEKLNRVASALSNGAIAQPTIPESLRLAAEAERKADADRTREGAPSPRRARRRGRKAPGTDQTENGA
jgi:hypothetical protein